MCDETTDVAIKKELIVYAHYMDESRIHTAFIGLCEVPNGRAQTILDALHELCDVESIDIEHI